MNNKKFFLFPWQRPFLEDLKAFIEADTAGNPGSALIIVPHKRPWRYLTDLYVRTGKASALPRMLAFSEVIDIWNANLGSQSRLSANPLDITALLAQIVKSECLQDSDLKAAFADMPFEKFLPWGIRLASLFEEMQSQGIEPQDIVYTNNEVSPNAAALLGSLGKIHHLLLEEINRRGWVTQGLACQTVLRNVAEIPPLLQPGLNRPVYIAGFYALNNVQDAVFNSLWKAGAKICLHTDPRIISDNEYSYHCQKHVEWLRDWRATAEIVVEDYDAAQEPEVTFWAGYDVHSQVVMLADLLQKEDMGHQTAAIVCTQPDILMPVLHHLPDKEVNISMGYPLKRSPLISFFESLLTAVESRHLDGRYYWKDLRSVLRQPYLKMLETSEGNLVEKFVLLDNALSLGKKFIDLPSFISSNLSGYADLQSDLAILTLQVCLENLQTVSTTLELADALERIRILLLEKGAAIWEKFPLDAEALNALATSIIPMLRHNEICSEKLSFPVLHGLFKSLLEDCRVPFEADPLTGLQILGLLETRLLHFDKVYILDATEDVLPGQTANDPLLSDFLRKVLGLSDSRTREAAIGHTLARLCHGTSTTAFFWQEGLTQSQLFDSKKTRSRFVEELIWKEERKRKSLLKNGEYPLHIAKAEIFVKAQAEKSLVRSDRLQEKMQEFFAKPVSPTSLDQYLRCPLGFVRARLLGLEAPREVNEGDDPPLVGQLIHRVLEKLFEPFLNKPLSKSDISQAKVFELFESEMQAMDMAAHLPLDSLLMLELAGPRKLFQYVEKVNNIDKILRLESTLRGKIKLPEQLVHLHGKVDRMDLRKSQVRVLDYKIGYVPEIRKQIWTNEQFFEKMRPYCEELLEIDENGHELFLELRKNLPSLQLPVYLFMLEQEKPGASENAAYIELRKDGTEIELFSDLDEEQKRKALDYCRLAIIFVMRHMLKFPVFYGLPDTCSFCDYRDLCLI